MVDDSDRMARASKYVLGLMGEDERERAERDLERDPTFRDAVSEIAERMHWFDLTKPSADLMPATWKTITKHITAMPQMHSSPAEVEAAPEPQRPIPTQGSGSSHIGSVSGWRAALMAGALLAACGIGYAAGSISTGVPAENCGTAGQ